MAQNITLLGASYPDVPAVTLPKTGGGTATFTDVTDTTAAAADVAQGKYFFDALGQLTIGTASGGGGSGLVTESGTWTPDKDTASTTIYWTKTHTSAPMIFTICDSTGTNHTTTYTNFAMSYIDYSKIGCLWPYGSNNMRYGAVSLYYRTTSTSQTSASTVLLTYPSTDPGSSTNSYPRYWATETRFYVYTNSTSRYWRGVRTYKWIAIWAPGES